MSEDGTTEIIRKRIRHWKTTVTGIVLILAPVAAVIWPEYAVKINAAAMALAGAGFVCAADASKSQ